MNLAGQLMIEMSTRNIRFVAQGIGENKEKFKNLVQLVYNTNPKLSMRAAWTLTIVTDKYPELLKPYIKDLVKVLPSLPHPGAVRGILRQLSKFEIPVKVQGRLFDFCYNMLISDDQPVSIKVFSMQILYNISQKEPGLKSELYQMLEDIIMKGCKAGISARARKLIKKLNCEIIMSV
jgi:hypothetical protein